MDANGPLLFAFSVVYYKPLMTILLHCITSPSTLTHTHTILSDHDDLDAHHQNRLSQRISFVVHANHDDDHHHNPLPDYPPVGADGVADRQSPFPLVRQMASAESSETSDTELRAPARIRTLSSGENEVWGHFEDGDGPVKIPSPSAAGHKSANLSPLTLPDSPRAANHVPTHHSTTRSRYNRAFMPNRVILVRHGQSEGNIDESLYATKPDPDMALTERGWCEARMAGRAIIKGHDKGHEREFEWNGIPVGMESIHFIVSPYVRTMETFHGILNEIVPVAKFAHISNSAARLSAWYTALQALKVSWHEDARIREQDFGNFQKPEEMRQFKRDRYRYGSFYYRFPHGESCSDVYDRCSTFLDSLWRSFEAKKADNYIIVAHGATMRVLLTRYFRYTVDQFQKLANPSNGEMMLLAHDGEGKLKFEGRLQLENVTGDEERNEKEATFRYHKTMRQNPPNRCSAPRAVRMSNDN